MVDLTLMPRLSLIVVVMALGSGSAWLAWNRVPRSVWSCYNAEERRLLRIAVARRNSRAIEEIAEPEHRALFDRVRRAVATVRVMVLGSIAISVVAFLISVAGRHLS